MTTPIDGVSAATAPTATAGIAAQQQGMLDPQAFMQLLVAQLQYQDPTSPADMSSFMSQTATLSQTQAITSMQTSLSSLLSTEQALTATSMIGKQVTYADSDGDLQTGLVSGATSLTTGAQLQIGNTTVPLTSVTSVKE